MEHKMQMLEVLEKNEDELRGEIPTVIREHIKDKSNKEIKEYLDVILREAPDETGGINAITGFYFQLMCTLYYLAELLEGKWEYLVLELHQDIIVGNVETVKFIQVKSEVLSDRKPVKEVTNTNLYRGWIQKLLSCARLFPYGCGVRTEFELLTNFFITNSRNVKVENYLYNNYFNQCINDSDDILCKVLNDPNRGLTDTFDFQRSCNESVKSMLSRFSIRPEATNPDKLEDFIGAVGSKFGNLINESAGVSPLDLNYMLGELCYECNHSNRGSLLYIDQERAHRYLNILKQKASRNLEDFYISNNNNLLIDEIITGISETYSNLKNPLKEQIENELELFRLQLKRWADEDIPVVEMVHRYMEGKDFSLSINKLNPLTLKEKAQEIFKTSFILKILYDDEIKISKKFKGLLMKEVHNAYISILGLDMDENYDEAINKLNRILEKASEEEKLYILMQHNHTIFQGEYNEDDFNVQETLNVNELVVLNSEDRNKSVMHVDYIWTIVPGIEFIGILKKARRYPDFATIQEKIRSEWETLLK